MRGSEDLMSHYGLHGMVLVLAVVSGKSAATLLPDLMPLEQFSGSQGHRAPLGTSRNSPSHLPLAGGGKWATGITIDGVRVS